MKKHATTLRELTCAMLLLASPALAQTAYVPLALTGYTADVVANGAGTVISSTTHDVDNGTVNNRFCFMAPDYVSPSGATPTVFLPATGLINSVAAATPGLSFQLAPYSGSNSLRIAGVGSGALVLATPRAAQEVYVLGVSGNMASTVTITVRFADGSTQVFANQVVADWFGGAGFAIQGIGRVNRDNNAIQNNTTDPRLYQIRLALDPANQAKLIQSVSFDKPAATGTLNIMALSVGTPPAPLPNDEPCGAVAVGNSPVSGTNGGATTSVQNGIVLPACTSSQAPKDVWFVFGSTGSSSTVRLSGAAAGMLRVFTAPTCNGPFTMISCHSAGAANTGFAAPIMLSGLAQGTSYYFAVSGFASTDATGSFTVSASNLLGRRAMAEKVALRAVPNPSRSGQLTLFLERRTAGGSVTLRNALGQPVRSALLTGSATQRIDTHGLAPGLYTVVAQSGSEVLTCKVVLE